jgi:hypothetical protein
VNAFHIAGIVLAGWAVVLTAVGLSRPDFPRSTAAARGVMAISLLLVALAVGAGVVTSAVEDAEHQEETLEHEQEAEAS